MRRLLDEGVRSIVVFTRFTGEAFDVARTIGSEAAVVTATTAPLERDRILGEFKKGRLRVVTNVGIIALGFDYPELEAVVLARPTLSLAVYYQQVGRVIRPSPGKPFARVVDMVGLVDLWTIWSGDRQLTQVYTPRHGAVGPQERIPFDVRESSRWS